MNKRTATDKERMARQLRRNQTPAERLLWAEIQEKRLGAGFRRQVVLCGWIVDFYCRKLRLAVEVDGPYHQYRPKKDAIRDKTLARCGIRTLRFTNEQIESDLSSVLEAIRQAVGDEPIRPKKRKTSVNNPSGVPIGIIIRNLMRKGKPFPEALEAARRIAAQQ